MKTLILTSALVLTGCLSQYPQTIDEYIPEYVAERKEWDGSKGQFPPGRVIDYKGHGLGYNSHANHHRHINNHK